MLLSSVFFKFRPLSKISAGGGGYAWFAPLPTCMRVGPRTFASESYVTTDGQPASLSWHKAPFWGLRPDLYYCLTVAGLLIWGALWREDGSVVYNSCWPSPAQSFSGPSPLGLVAIFTVSDSRLPFSSPPTTRRVTVEVFDPAYTLLPHFCFKDLFFHVDTFSLKEMGKLKDTL
jgi:hypothetical protein